MVTKPSATTMLIRPLLQYRIIQFTLYADMILLGKWNHLGNIDVPIEVQPLNTKLFEGCRKVGNPSVSYSFEDGPSRNDKAGGKLAKLTHSSLKEIIVNFKPIY